MHRVVSILLGLAIMGAVLGVAALMLVFLGQDWEDALFWILAAVMLGAGGEGNVNRGEPGGSGTGHARLR